jgi:hypothetical protein
MRVAIYDHGRTLIATQRFGCVGDLAPYTGKIAHTTRRSPPDSPRAGRADGPPGGGRALCEVDVCTIGAGGQRRRL